MRARWPWASLIAVAACGGGASGPSRQECEAVLAHLIALEHADGPFDTLTCAFDPGCDGVRRDELLRACPSILSKRDAACYQRATSLAAANACLELTELFARLDEGGSRRSYGYGGSTFPGASPAPGASTFPGATPRRSAALARALDQLSGLRDEACDCHDPGCAAAVEARLEALVTRYGDSLDDELDRAPDVKARAQALGEEAMRCLASAGAPPDAAPAWADPYALPPPDAAPAWADPYALPPPDAATAYVPYPGGADPGAPLAGFPGCDAYVRALEAYVACDQLPASARDAARQSVDALRKSLADLASFPADSRQTIDDSCRQGADAIRQSAAMLGCAVP